MLLPMIDINQWEYFYLYFYKDLFYEHLLNYQEKLYCFLLNKEFLLVNHFFYELHLRLYLNLI